MQPGVAAASAFVAEAALLLGGPLLYLSLLRLACLLENPLAGGGLGGPPGFPTSAFHVFMRDECEAFHTAGQEQPKAIARAVEQLLPRSGTSVHDRVKVDA